MKPGQDKGGQGDQMLRGERVAVRFSDEDEGASSDDETWITAAKSDQYGYCAWRVKRCLLKQGVNFTNPQDEFDYRSWLVRAPALSFSRCPEAFMSGEGDSLRKQLQLIILDCMPCAQHVRAA